MVEHNKALRKIKEKECCFILKLWSEISNKNQDCLNHLHGFMLKRVKRNNRDHDVNQDFFQYTTPQLDRFRKIISDVL